MNVNELSKIDLAKDLAQQIHMGQLRKVSKEPYIIHPYRVFLRLKSMGYNKDTQLIGLLHDGYEDAKNKKNAEEKIKSMFGNVIFNFIKLLSHDKIVNYNKYVLEIAKRSNTALIVKCIDMYENLIDNPSEKQKNKYFSAIQHLLDNKIHIDDKIINLFKRFKTG